MESWLAETVKYADFVLLVVDLGSETFLDQAKVVLRRLEESRVMLVAQEEEKDDEADSHFYKKGMIVGNKNDMPLDAARPMISLATSSEGPSCSESPIS